MDDFLSQLLKPIFIFIIGLLIGIFKAYTKQSVLSRKGELLSYHQYLKKTSFLDILNNVYFGRFIRIRNANGHYRNIPKSIDYWIICGRSCLYFHDLGGGPY
jgi:hypothetical protein